LTLRPATKFASAEGHLDGEFQIRGIKGLENEAQWSRALRTGPNVAFAMAGKIDDPDIRSFLDLLGELDAT
jgi:hypothetical protein